MSFQIGRTTPMAGVPDRTGPQVLNPTALAGYLLVVFAVTLATRLLNLGQLPLTGLEAITLRVVAMDWSELFQNRIAATHSPFYFALVKLGYSGELVSARLPSALFDGGTAVILAIIGNRIGQRSGAIFAAGLFIFWPILWDTGQTARPYAALNFGTALLLLGAVMACDRDRAPDETSRGFRSSRLHVGIPAALLCVGGSMVAVFSTSLGVLSWAAVDAAVLLVCLLERRWATARDWLVLRTISIAVWLPLALQLFKPTSSKAAAYWVQGGPDRFLRMLEEVWFMRYSLLSERVISGWTQPALYVVLPILFLLGAATLWSRSRNVLILLCGVAFLPVLAIAILSLHTPLTVPRYGQVAALGMVLVASAGLHRLWRDPRAWSKAACALAAAAIMLHSWDFVAEPRRHDYRPASKTIVEADASDPLFLVSASYVPADATANLAKRHHEYFRLDKLRDALARADTVWLIDMRRGKDLQSALDGLDVRNISITSYPQPTYALHRIVRDGDSGS